MGASAAGGAGAPSAGAVAGGVGAGTDGASGTGTVCGWGAVSCPEGSLTASTPCSARPLAALRTSASCAARNGRSAPPSLRSVDAPVLSAMLVPRCDARSQEASLPHCNNLRHPSAGSLHNRPFAGPESAGSLHNRPFAGPSPAVSRPAAQPPGYARSADPSLVPCSVRSRPVRAQNAPDRADAADDCAPAGSPAGFRAARRALPRHVPAG